MFSLFPIGPRGRSLVAAVCGLWLSLSLTLAVSAQPQPPTPVQVPAMAGRTLVLGPGDQLRIGVFQNAELSLEARVDGEGRITYPFLQMVDVGGRTPAQVEQLIARGLEQKEVLRRPQVSVSVIQYRSQQVAVLGYVNRPGPYVLDMALTVSGALAQAGGVGAGGADSVVLSRVQDGVLKNSEIDLVQMFRPGASRLADIALLPGDVLYVHRAPAFYIYGEVQRPGMQRLEHAMTVMQALSAGGGLTPRGTERGIRVTRRSAEGELQTVEVQLDSTLQADDVVQVRESLF